MSRDERIVQRLIATALNARLIPPDRVHLFAGIPPDNGFVEALESFASVDGELQGLVCGRDAYKTARSCINLVAVNSVERLERTVAVIKGGNYASVRSRALIGLRVARLLLSIDRHRGWLPQLTLERFLHVIVDLGKYCSGDPVVRRIGPELAADLRAWLSAKPAARVASQEDIYTHAP